MRRRTTAAFLVFLSALVLTLGIGDASAERRVAMVIGNAQYKDPAIALTNSANDAEDVAASLKTLGFDVVLMLNATTREMDIGLKRFSDFAATADTVLVYYAGHALQVQGNNYLMPVDGQLEDETDLRRSMVSDEQIRIALDRAKGVKILILDACRNNPLADRFKRNVLGPTRGVELTRGLARIDRAQGMLVAYAAAPGEVALDGNTTGRNSPFATALLRWMREPALEISTMFRRVTQDVVTLTRNQQRPEYNSTLGIDYFLDPVADRRAWERVRESNDSALIREFMIQFPNSTHVADARNRLELVDRARSQPDSQASRPQPNPPLAALEEERNRQGREEEQRQRLQRERAQAEQKCTDERRELAAIGGDLGRLKTFATQSACNEVRVAAVEVISRLERDDNTCVEEGARRTALLNQVKGTSNLARLTRLKNDLAKLEQGMACARERSAVTEALGAMRVLIAQVELKRVGCFDGESDGIMNDQTRDGAKKFLVALGRPETGGDVTEDLLSSLKEQTKTPVCKAEPATSGGDSKRRNAKSRNTKSASTSTERKQGRTAGRDTANRSSSIPTVTACVERARAAGYQGFGVRSAVQRCRAGERI